MSWVLLPSAAAESPFSRRRGSHCAPGRSISHASAKNKSKTHGRVWGSSFFSYHLRKWISVASEIKEASSSSALGNILRFSSSVSSYSNTWKYFHSFFYSNTTNLSPFPSDDRSPTSALRLLIGQPIILTTYNHFLVPITVCIQDRPFFGRWGNKTLTCFPLVRKNMSCVTQAPEVSLAACQKSWSWSQLNSQRPSPQRVDRNNTPAAADSRHTLRDFFYCSKIVKWKKRLCAA